MGIVFAQQRPQRTQQVIYSFSCPGIGSGAPGVLTVRMESSLKNVKDPRDVSEAMTADY